MFEYKMVTADLHWKDNNKRFEQKLNEYARDGWRVVNVVMHSNFVAFLERSKAR